jgi:hypothetical protein
LEGDKNIATMTFEEREIPDSKEKYWNIQHRFIKSKEIGVSGTDFLKKAEEFLKIFKKNNLLDTTIIGCGASQPSVISWLVNKNDFKFYEKNKYNLADYGEFKDGLFVPNDKYELLKVYDQYNEMMKDDYLIDKNFLLDKNNGERWQKCMQKSPLSNEIVFIIKKDKMPEGSTSNDELDELRELGYIPRFYVAKEI